MSGIKSLTQLAAGAALAVAVSTTYAGAVLDTGKVTMGVNNDGSLGFAGVGLALVGGPGDAITPGCLCEGWGAASNGVGSYTYAGGSSTSGIASSTFVAGPTADAAVSTVTLSSGLVVTHTYSSAAGGDLFKIDISIENTTGATATDVRYSRTLDWDVPPGHFSDDFTTIYAGSPTGPAGDVLHTSFDPFAVPNPMVTRSTLADTSAVDIVGDRGAYFILGFGDLAAGASKDFTTYIGATESVSDLLGAFASVGIEAYTYSYDDAETSAFGWGFGEIGLPPVFETPVSEPAGLGLLALGLAGLGLVRRNKKA